MKYTQGFIALTSVIILSAIFLSVTISVATRAIMVSGTSSAFRERDTSRYLALACAEYARLKLQRTLDYGGNEGILIGDGACEILAIQGSGNTNRVLRVQSQTGTHTYRIEEVIESVSPELIISSSARVIQF